MLTEDQIAAARPRERGYKLSDYRGLHVYVTPKGAKSFRLKYRFGGAERRLTFGLYPSITLQDARKLRDQARLALRAGLDPATTPSVAPETVDRLVCSDRSERQVYFLQAEDGSIKIGVTQDVARRVRNIELARGEGVELMGCMAGSYALEMTLHRMFADDRIEGEWFRPSQRLLDFIEDETDRARTRCL